VLHFLQAEGSGTTGILIVFVVVMNEAEGSGAAGILIF
jgi:hypothetical protein